MSTLKTQKSKTASAYRREPGLCKDSSFNDLKDKIQEVIDKNFQSMANYCIPAI